MCLTQKKTTMFPSQTWRCRVYYYYHLFYYHACKVCKDVVSLSSPPSASAPAKHKQQIFMHTQLYYLLNKLLIYARHTIRQADKHGRLFFFTRGNGFINLALLLLVFLLQEMKSMHFKLLFLFGMFYNAYLCCRKNRKKM